MRYLYAGKILTKSKIDKMTEARIGDIISFAAKKKVALDFAWESYKETNENNWGKNFMVSMLHGTMGDAVSYITFMENDFRERLQDPAILGKRVKQSFVNHCINRVGAIAGKMNGSFTPIYNKIEFESATL